MVITLPAPTACPHWLAASSAAIWLCSEVTDAATAFSWSAVRAARNCAPMPDCWLARVAALGVPSATAWSTFHRSGSTWPDTWLLRLTSDCSPAIAGSSFSPVAMAPVLSPLAIWSLSWVASGCDVTGVEVGAGGHRHQVPGAGQHRLRAARGLQLVGQLGLLGGDHGGSLLGEEALPRCRQAGDGRRRGGGAELARPLTRRRHGAAGKPGGLLLGEVVPLRDQRLRLGALGVERRAPRRGCLSAQAAQERLAVVAEPGGRPCRRGRPLAGELGAQRRKARCRDALRPGRGPTEPAGLRGGGAEGALAVAGGVRGDGPGRDDTQEEGRDQVAQAHGEEDSEVGMNELYPVSQRRSSAEEN